MIDGQKGIENWKSMCRGAFLIKKWKDKSNQSNVNILVHCHQGLNRSACVIACFLVKYLEWNSHQAIRWIQSRRPGSLNYLGFKKMIWKIEREKNISQTQDKNNNIN